MEDLPRLMTSTDWAAISGLLIPFWVLFVAVIGFAGSMLLAHGMIPSLAMSRELPTPALTRLRPPLYTVALLCFLLAVTMVVAIVQRIGILSSVFDSRLV